MPLDSPNPPPIVDRVTDPALDARLLYFTSPSLTADGRRIYFVRESTGHPNLCSLDLQAGTITRHSDNHDGSLLSAGYFDGNPYAGFGKASPSLDPRTGDVYYLQGRQIIASNAAGERRVLATYPADQMTACTHVSADGRRLCVPTVDARAFDGTPSDTDRRVQAMGLSSWLRVYDTASGEMLLEERVPRGWVTHVQFSPTDPDVILYNHEWPSDCGVRRMWLWDGREHRPLRTASADRRRTEDWVCHEVWEPDGHAVIYHGTLGDDPFVGRLTLDDDAEPVEIVLPTASRRYGHFTPGPTGDLVTDGYFETPSDPAGSEGAWLSHLRIDWDARKIAWTPLCRHGSSWSSQDVHPHPVFGPDGKTVWFTSDTTGRSAIWRIACM